MKKILVLCLLASSIVGAFYLAYLGAHSWKAHQKGFEHYTSVVTKTNYGLKRNIDIYWNAPKSVPGVHPILIQIHDADGRQYEQKMSSPDRVTLKSVEVFHEDKGDALIFKYLLTDGVTGTNVLYRMYDTTLIRSDR